MAMDTDQLNTIFPVTFKIIGAQGVKQIFQGVPDQFDPLSVPDFLRGQTMFPDLPGYLYDLASIEVHTYLAVQRQEQLATPPARLSINPTLAIVETAWQGLADFFGPTLPPPNFAPEQGRQYIVIFMHPLTRKLQVLSASSLDLLAVKIVVEDRSRQQIAQSEQTTLRTLDHAVELAIVKGLLLKPLSAISRNDDIFDPDQTILPKFLAAETFTLQWHITQACDLHCKHCYDRSQRRPVTREEADCIMDQLYDFCHARNVHGQISFTGGNPLLHENFFELYQGAADRGFMTAILGNPTTPEILSKIKMIQLPEFYQVSLEGLEQHNDYIRGQGHFSRVIQFLKELREAGIYSMVMLTLTRDNLNQVLPLAEFLRSQVDLFTFNRLSAVGEGAQLLTPTKEEYLTFLHEFSQAQQGNPILANKDNMINILRLQEDKPLFGGCAGFGCGAAFNFVSLLPDGEVQACRKFNSPIGNIHKQTLAAIYDSIEAASYRKGPKQCQGCVIRHVCGGCLAVIDSQGLDRTYDRDPCCFIEATA